MFKSAFDIFLAINSSLSSSGCVVKESIHVRIYTPKTGKSKYGLIVYHLTSIIGKQKVIGFQ
jgi:hypothetical protein